MAAPPTPVNTSRLTPARAEGLERAGTAYEMRLRGHTLTEIAEALGYSDITAARIAIERLLDKHQEAVVAHSRVMATDRIEAVLRVLWPKVMEGELPAIDRWLKAVEILSRIQGVVQGGHQINVENVVNAPTIAIMPQPVDYRAAMKPILSPPPDPHAPDAPTVIDGDYSVAGPETGPE